MQSLDTLALSELQEYVESFEWPYSRRPSPVTNGIDNTSVVGAVNSGDAFNARGTVFLTQKFLTLVASLSSGAPYPNDLFICFRHILTTVAEDVYLTPERLHSFDIDYSNMTHARGMRYSVDRHSAALSQLDDARWALREAQAQVEHSETESTVDAL